MSKRNIFILVAVLGLTVFVVKSYTSGVKQTGNVVREYDTIEKILQSVNYKVNIPKQVYEDEFIDANNYQGAMIEINTKNYSIRAGLFKDNKACLFGEYSKYPVTYDYEVVGENSIVYLRLRGNGNTFNLTNAIVDYNTGDVGYSLKINGETSLKEILEILGIDSLWLKDTNEFKD